MSDPTNTKIRFDVPQLLARSVLYQALALLFRHPSAHPKEALAQDVLGQWREAAGVLSPGETSRLVETLSALINQLEHITPSEWIYDYERAFGHSAHGACPPYELEYGDEHSHRQPQELGDIAAFYEAFGLGLSGRGHERVDHASVECEFMHYLIFKEAYALREGTEEQAIICAAAAWGFLADHPGRWLPAFAHRLAKHTAQGLIKAHADFAFEFIVQDCEMLGLPAGPRDLPIRMMTQREEEGCTSCSLKSLWGKGDT